MRILSFDPANSTGWAVTEILDDKAVIIDYGDFSISPSEFMGDRCNEMFNKTTSMIVGMDINFVTIESYFFSRLTANGSNVNAAFRTAIHMACRQLKTDYEILNISAWKRCIAGRSTPTKEQKKQYGKAKANKAFIQQALWTRFGIKFPNHSISEKTGKPVLPRNDYIDAVSMAIYYANAFMNITKPNISCSVVPVPDVKMKKTKKAFKYE
ncbi:MAG: hypothetical protein DRI46_11855 [Chloroflexi bacterium]|nr:MAG: hypothetical protein DRI46_11855 [Chloroflexota bacterium]